MEALTRLVTDSLARHGLDRPIDPRRLQWSRWSRCDSAHSLLVVPSKPGIFAIAEEVAAFSGPSEPTSRNPERSEAPGEAQVLGRAALQRSNSVPPLNAALAAEMRRMLAVLQFCEDDDMAFTLDRMFTRINPMRARLSSGRCFLRFVVIADLEQRRTICTALNQWLLTSAEKATGLPADFSSSLEAVSGTTMVTQANERKPEAIKPPAPVIPFVAKVPFANAASPATFQDGGAASNLHCPHPLPSGF